MDRDDAIEESANLTLAEPPRAVPAGPVIVSVCVTCKIWDSGAMVGPDMFAAVQAAIGDGDPNVQVRPVAGGDPRARRARGLPDIVAVEPDVRAAGSRNRSPPSHALSRGPKISDCLFLQRGRPWSGAGVTTPPR